MLEKLGIQPFSLIAQIINFLILFFLLSKFLYQPILKMLDERKRRIKESLEKEKKIEEEAAKLETVRLKKREEAEKEAQEIVRRAKAVAAEERRKAKEKIRKTIQEAKKQAHEEFKKEKEALVTRFREQAAELVLLTTKQVLRASLGKTTQKKLIRSVLGELKKIKPIQ